MSKSDREICEAATAGPWEYNDEDKRIYSIGFEPIAKDISWHNDSGKFIAHFNPTKLLQMLDESDAKDILHTAQIMHRIPIDLIPKEVTWASILSAVSRLKQQRNNADVENRGKDKRIKEVQGALWELMKEHEVPMSDYYKELLA